MMKFNAVKLAFPLCVVLALMGCGAKHATPVELVFGLTSYSPIDQVRARVVQQGGKWNVVENNALNTSDARPKYEYVRVQTDVFNDGGYHGKTLLSFYNGKLMSVWFYADDWEKYKKYLEEHRGVIIKDNAWEQQSGGVRSWVAMDHEKKHYIAWEDATLSNSMKRWIEKYS